MRELHEGDHKVVFDMVGKKDEALYKALAFQLISQIHIKGAALPGRSLL